MEERVLSSLRQEARAILRPEDLEELKSIPVCNEAQENQEAQLRHVEKRMEKLERFKRKTYDSYMEGMISGEEYTRYASEYDRELAKLKGQKALICHELDLQQETEDGYDEWTEGFLDYINVKKLTRDMVLELIERIEVHKEGELTIYYKFRNRDTGECLP